MKKAWKLFLLLLLIGCGDKSDYSQSVVFGGGSYETISAVRIQNDGSWVGISLKGDCVPSIIFYKKKGDWTLSRFDRPEEERRVFKC